MKKWNDKKIPVGTITKKNPSTMIAAAATITPVLASAARILGIRKQRSQQTYERKGIMNKKIYLYYLAGTMIAIAGTAWGNGIRIHFVLLRLLLYSSGIFVGHFVIHKPQPLHFSSST